MTNKEAIEYIKLIFVRDRANELHFISHNEEIALGLAIKALEEQWIPVSERLPERDETVLVSYKTGSVHLCKYLDDGSENPWWSYIDDCCEWNNVVIAWMPMPEPYKKGDEENE